MKNNPTYIEIGQSVNIEYSRDDEAHCWRMLRKLEDDELQEINSPQDIDRGLKNRIREQLLLNSLMENKKNDKLS